MRQWIRRLLATWRNRHLERDMEDEIAFHLEMETLKYQRAGEAPESARRQARLAFGAADRFREESRDVRGISWVEAGARELRLSIRRLLREPAFTMAVVLTLAVALGAAASVLTLVDTVLLRPLPYPDSERLVLLAHRAPGLGIAETGQSSGTLAHYRRHAQTLEEAGAYLENDVSITDGDVAERVHIAMIDPAVLRLLLPRPQVGAHFSGGDESEIIISHDLWQRRYGGDPAIVGRTIETNRTPDRVVGVMPPGFDFPRPGTDIWMAMTPDAEPTRAGIDDLYYTGVGRLRPGFTAADAEAELTGILARLPDSFGDVTHAQLGEAQLRPVVRTLHDHATAGIRQPLRLLLVFLAVVLVIALANTTNLVLLRAERQRRQIAVARALGAGGTDVARRLLVENTLLTMAGAALGTALALAAVSARFGFEPGALPRLHELAVTPRIHALVAVLALITAAVLAAAAHLRSGGGAAGALLYGADRATLSRGAQRAQGGLVGLQVALAFVLLVSSAAMVRSIWRLQQVELGFRADDIVTFEVNPPARPYLSYGSAAALHAQIRDALLSTPGVSRVEAARTLPLTADLADLRETVTAVGDAATPPVSASINLATPGYFQTLGIPLLRGRTFSRADLQAESPGVIVSASLARLLFGDADPIGRSIRMTSAAASYPAYTVTAVAADVAADRIDAAPRPTLYLPAIFDETLGSAFRADMPYVPREITIIVRTTLDAPALAAAARQAMRSVDAKIPVVRVQPLQTAVDRATLRLRLVAALLMCAAVAALFLGAVGLWGVVAYSLERRTPELAIRVAVGAEARHIVSSILRSALVIVVLGLTGGALAAFAVSRSMAALLFEVEPMDAASTALVAALLLVVALAACVAPARRALRIEPATLLRSQ